MSVIISQAYREGNFTPIGEEPTLDEAAEALPRLNNYISSLLGVELGEQLREFYIPQAWNPAGSLRLLTPDGSAALSTDHYAYPPVNSRLMVKFTDARTIYFPAVPNDGSRMGYVDLASTANVTLDGNGRLIEGVASLVGSPATVDELDVPIPATLTGREWLYRSDLGTWIRLQPLLATDIVPLGPEWDDLLVTGLCIRLCARMGVMEPVKKLPSTFARNAEMLSKLKKRFKQSERMPATSEYRSMAREI